MKLTHAAELAVRGTLVLADEYGQGPVPLAEICRRRDLPREYMTKIFSALSRAGLLNPIRGKGGGYVLSRDPSEITLLEVIEAVEGPIVLNFCQHDPPQCERDDCPVRPVWSDLQDHIRTTLGSKTLAEFIG